MIRVRPRFADQPPLAPKVTGSATEWQEVHDVSSGFGRPGSRTELWDIFRNVPPATASVWQLVVMLVLTQWSVSLLVVERLLTWGFRLTYECSWEAFRAAVVLIVVLLTGAGVAFMNLYHRGLRVRAPDCPPLLAGERIAIILFLVLVGVYFGILQGLMPFAVPAWGVEVCGWLAAATGLVALLVSGMAQVAARRETWTAWRVMRQFGCSTILLGLSSALVATNLARIHVAELRNSAVATFVACLSLQALAVISSARLLHSRRLLRRYGDPPSLAGADGETVDARIIAQLQGNYAGLLRLQTSLAVCWGTVIALLVATHDALSDYFVSDIAVAVQTVLLGVVVTLRWSSEILERYLFCADGIW